MPLEKLVLILVVVAVAAGLTVAMGAWLAGFLAVPGFALTVAIPFALIAYIAVRVISERLKNKEDDHYDSIER